MGCPILTFAQQNYSIQLNVKQIGQPGKAYLNYQSGDRQVSDSASMIAGSYHFKGTAQEPVLARITVRANGPGGSKSVPFYIQVWLENVPVKVVSEGPSSPTLIHGGQLNADYQQLEASKLPDRATMEAATDKVSTATEEQQKSPEFLKQHMLVMKAAMNKSAIRDSLYINTHPASWLSLYLIAGTVSTTSPAELQQRFSALSKTLQTSTAGKELSKTIAVLQNREVGGKAADFTLTNAQGKTVTLSSFRGRYVLLDFWASWCVPCRKENPNIRAAYAKYKDKNFTVLSVSIDVPEARAKWLAAVAEDKLDWPQLCDAPGGSNQAAMLYNVSFIPQNFLIDPAGKIIAKNLHGEALQKEMAVVMQ
jgi:peroxiredoxin